MGSVVYWSIHEINNQNYYVRANGSLFSTLYGYLCWKFHHFLGKDADPFC